MKAVILFLYFLFALISIVKAASNPLSNCTGGRITYYSYNNNGQCSFGAIGGTLLKHPFIVAPNDAFYGTDGGKCGVCYELTGPTGSVIVQVADRCPANGNSGCRGDIDHFDLGPNKTTFGQIADPVWGTTMITKREVACPVTGNVGVRTKDAVSSAWMAILVFNHRVGISNVQIQHGGVYLNMTRQIYNYWTIFPSGGLVAPFNIKIFSKLGDVISMTIPSLAAEQIYMAGSQFPVPPAGYGGSTSGAKPCPVPEVSPIIYSDSLFKGLSPSVAWRDVSFGLASPISWNHTVNPKVGTNCMKVTLNSYGAVQLLRTVPFNVTVFQYLSFWARMDGTSFNKWKVTAQGGGSKSVTLTNSWTLFTLSLNSSGLNAPNPFGGNNGKIQFQNNQNAVSPTIYMDEIEFI